MAGFNIPKPLLKPSKFETKEGKAAIRSYIKKYINEQLDAGLSRDEVRKTLKPFNVGKKKIEIQKFNQYLDKKSSNITLYDSANRAKKNAREGILETMGDKTGSATETKYGRSARNLPIGQQDHHIRFRTLFEPFYDGLDEADAKELTKWFVQGKSPLGNVIENLEGIDSDLHQELETSLHTWAKDQQIDVKGFTKDEWSAGNRNIQNGIVRGGADNEVIEARKTPRAKFPNFEGTNLNNRKNAARLWLNTIEEPLLNKTAEIMEQQDVRYAKKDPNYKPKNKTQWLDKWDQSTSNAAARSTIMEDNPGVKVSDLDSADVSPTLAKRVKSGISGVGGKLNTADSVAQIIGGNPIGGGFGLLMQQPAFHKQIGKVLGERLAKSGAKLIPGVGMTMGTLEAAGYASQGRLTQAGISTFSAIIGEVPGIGDVLSAGADLLNTGIDIATGNMGKVQMEMDDVIEFDGLPVRALKAARNAA